MTPLPSNASIVFNRRASELVAEKKINWHQAYHHIIDHETHLFDAMPEECSFKKIIVGGIIKNRLRAANRFNEKVVNRQYAKKCNFQQAFDYVRESEPELYAAMTAEK